MLPKGQKLEIVTARLEFLVMLYPNPAEATREQMDIWLAESPWLHQAAAVSGLDTDLLVGASMAWRMASGFRFAKQNGRPPTIDDWKASFYNDANAFAKFLGIFQPFDRPDNALRREYGGT